jgi:hypothetical protein
MIGKPLQNRPKAVKSCIQNPPGNAVFLTNRTPLTFHLCYLTLSGLESKNPEIWVSFAGIFWGLRLRYSVRGDNLTPLGPALTARFPEHMLQFFN